MGGEPKRTGARPGGCRVATQSIYERSTGAVHDDLQDQAVPQQGGDQGAIEVFAEAGPGPGTTAHYVAADGSHGVVVAETDDIAGAYRNIQNYTQWVEYDTNVMLPVEEAVPLIMDALS